MEIDGFYVIDKPAGITSHDVVSKVRKALGTRKVGHAGTLDPMATGVLIVGVGAATRLLRFVEATKKTYEARVRFGTRTDSLDAMGEVTEHGPTDHLARQMVEEALAAFRGDIEQIPPMVSALKVDGERLHAKARRGEEVERAPRRVTVHELELQDFQPGDPPEAFLRVVCSAGTYVRTLADDLGVALGTRAHLAGLRRTAVGDASVEDSCTLETIEASIKKQIADVSAMRVRDLTAEEADWIRHGRRIPPIGATEPYLAALDGDLVAVLVDGPDKVRIEVGMPVGVSIPVASA